MHLPLTLTIPNTNLSDLLDLQFSPCKNPALVSGDRQQKRLQPRQGLFSEVASHLLGSINHTFCKGSGIRFRAQHDQL